MIDVELFLKSGQTIKFTCKKYNFTYSKITGEYVAYSFVGIKEFDNVSLVPDQIAAYTAKDGA